MSLRFGIVGCGAISEEMHIPALRSHPEVRLVAAIDSDLAQARHSAAQHGFERAHRSLAEASDSLDAVVICTPPHVRPALIATAAEAGLHVLAEKPLANSAQECAQILDVVSRTGIVLAVSHMFRFYPVRAEMHGLVAQHDLGRILSVRMHEGAPYAWQTRSGYTFKRGEVSGGVLVNAGIHSLDSLLDWLGDASIEAYEDDAIGGLESNVRARLSFPDNVTADFRISRTCRLSSLFRIVCERGTLVFSNRDTVEYAIEREGGTTRHRHPSTLATPADCWRAQLDDFVAAIAGRGAPRIDGAEGTRVVDLVESMYRMKRERAPLSVVPLPGMTW